MDSLNLFERHIFQNKLLSYTWISMYTNYNFSSCSKIFKYFLVRVPYYRNITKQVNNANKIYAL